ncbi:MAG: ABC transporter permease [Pseudomonadota bacterium]
MLISLIKRFLATIPVIIIVSFLTFFFEELSPGNYLSSLKQNPAISTELIETYENDFGLNKPFVIRYLLWLKNAVLGNFGYSFSNKASVSSLIFDRVSNTLSLAIISLFISWVIIILFGSICAFKQDSWFDKAISMISNFGISMPKIFLALIVLFIAIKTGWFPVGGMKSYNYEDLSFISKIMDRANHLFLPVFVLTFSTAALYIRQMRASMIDVLDNNYILTAKSKGLTEKAIITNHALRAALNPMIVLFSYSLVSIINGSLIVEIVLAWPGMARLGLDALLNQDTPLLTGVVLFSAIVLILGNLLADLLLVLNDPKVKASEVL